ncbi:DUF1758 domain-containing protein [Trichonephila clavipes]|nr:DUF1758 domain-containing protein [Trichonephila clavipes]
MDKLNNSKRAIKGTITKIETFVEESGNHTPTKLDIKLKRVQEMNRKIDELKDQYYDIKDISESELQVIEADTQTSLQGVAKLLEAVDDSFESLITVLKTRFENKRLLTETHINAILEIEKLTSESARDIRTMTDILSKNIRALKLLGFERNNLSDFILLNIILKKIDRETRKQFEQSIDSNQIPELDTFIMFLEKRSQTIDSINRSAPITHKPKQVSFHKGKIFLNLNDSSNSCAICKLPHLIYKCSTYQNMKVSDRFNQIKRLNLCINCLKEHHKIKDCKSKNSCSVCKKRHHTSLHIFEAIPLPLSTTLANELTPLPDMQGSTTPDHSYTFSNCGRKEKYFTPDCNSLPQGGRESAFPLQSDFRLRISSFLHSTTAG